MKEHLKECLRSYFIIVTLINFAMYVLGMIFEPDMQFGYEAYLYPLLYGLLGSIPNLLLWEKKEPSARQYLVREIIAVALCVVILLTFMFAGKPFTPEYIKMACGVAASVVIIFIAVSILLWMLDSKTAKDMTEELRAYQQQEE